MKLAILLLLVSATVVIGEVDASVADANSNNRDGKFFSLFSIVRFANDVCKGTDKTAGTCYTASQCTKFKGEKIGVCASGFGVCCSFKKSCGQTTDKNCTYFQNPGYSSSVSGATNCKLTVKKCGKNVCQLRLDFEEFILAQPNNVKDIKATNMAGQCITDKFSVSGGSGGPIGPLCGVNKDQHVIVDIGHSSNPAMITVNIGSTKFERKWKVKITQIECTSELRAPTGCLQYHTEISGKIYSFNFFAPTPGTTESYQHLANQKYGICFRMEPGYCSIRYMKPTDPAQVFHISGTETTDKAANKDSECKSDYLIIPKGSDGTNKVDRHCGTDIKPVTSTIKPFVLYFITDDKEVEKETGRRGFCLQYEQLPC